MRLKRRLRGPRSTYLLVLLCLCAATDCRSPTGLTLGDADLRVLFVGNSLTYTNDLPGMVAALAGAEGLDLAYAEQTRPNYGLVDHWSAGIDDVIADLRPDVVVLQQGPSSLDSSREVLLEWTANIADVVARSGGRTALFMVWPESARPYAFDAVRQNYSDAAASVGGIFMPAGETWRAAWAKDPDLALYGPDGFHPSRLGSAAAAITVYAMLAGREGTDPPCRAEVLVDTATAELLCAAMREAVAQYGIW